MSDHNDLREETTRPDSALEAEPRPRSRARRVVGVIAFLILLAIAAAVFLATAASGFLVRPRDTAGEDIIFEIRPGQGLRTVTQGLAREELIRSAVALELYGRQQGYAGRLQAGRYLVSAAMPPIQIIQMIVSGDAVFDEFTFTIPEGWSLNDIEDYFDAVGLFARDEFQQSVVMQEEYGDFPFLENVATDTILDGYLFPDTYRVFSDSTPQTVVRRMLTNFGSRVTEEIHSEIEAQGRTLHGVLTLASIVQAEASGADEMPNVAGVFWNRLREWIPLESDATVNYVLGTSKLQPTFADTEVDSPYNTYENYGLPPGPIGNPGIDAIRAALSPPDHDYYFFLHRPTGEIVLSKTFEEHLQNKAFYLD